ncbi:MAG: hypothetical protein KCHDKBKB_01864 [Elusimicrobia bacterium]|nr:hypothetical protein [Elusimicrobiota bacterium]
MELNLLKNRSHPLLFNPPLSLPASIGTFRKRNAGHSGLTVIHISDIHLNHEAQENIGNMVTQLMKAGEVRLVALEGAFETIHMDRFRSFSDQDALRRAAKYALKKNQISGAVHSCLTFDGKAPALVGIDDEISYKTNMEAYRQAHALIPAMKSSLKEERAYNNKEAEQLFGPELLALYNQSIAYRANQINTGTYLRFLSDAGADLALELETFLAASEIESALDFSQAGRERTLFFERLAVSLSRQAVRDLENKSSAFRWGQINQAGYYSYLRELSKNVGLDLAHYPAFAEYVRYILLSNDINVEKLYRSLDETEDRLFKQLIQTPLERAVVAKSKRLALSEKLVDFSLTPEEWKEYCRSEPMARPTSRELQPFESFYREAEKRDRKMAENLLKAVHGAGNNQSHQGPSTVVLVTGGFHARGIEEILTKAGATVVSFVPRITKVETVSGAENLSLFVQEKAPLEKLFEGQKLFLSQNPANLIHLIPGIAAVKAVTTPAVPAQQVVDGLLPQGHGSRMTARKKGNEVLVTLQYRGQNETTAYQVDPQGNIQSDRRIRPNPLPELLALTLTLWLGTSVFINPAAFILQLAFTIAATRLVWFSSIFVHGLGHVVFKWWVDKNYRMSLTEAAEGITLSEFFLGLLPFAPIFTPWLSNRISVAPGDPDPEKVSFKALGGPVFNIFSAGAAAGALVFLSRFPGHPFYLSALLYLFLVLNFVFLAASVSDFESFATGLAPDGFACGFLDYFSPLRKLIGGESRFTYGPMYRNQQLVRQQKEQRQYSNGRWTGVIQRAVEQITTTTKILSNRGTQAYGFEVKLRTPQGAVVLAGLKDVNPKRATLHRRLAEDLVKILNRAILSGLTVLDDFFSYSSHLRFGTSSAPSKIETHPHASPEQWVERYNWSDPSRAIRQVREIFQISIKHNGDNDGIKDIEEVLEMYPFYVFGKNYSFKEIRRQLNRILYRDPTRGDSPVIASLLSLFITQGRFDAAARLAYIQMADTFQNAFQDLDNPSKVDRIAKTWGAAFESIFKKHQEHIFERSEIGWTPNVAYIKQVFLPALKNALGHNRQIVEDPYLRALFTHEENFDAFIQSTVHLFLYNDTYRGIQMMVSSAQSSSTFGLSVNNTLEPKKNFWLAKGQPAAMGHNPATGEIITASDPGAVLGALNENSRILTFNDSQGEIVVLDMEDPWSPHMSIFSLSAHRELTSEEIESRWVNLEKNPYIKIPDKNGNGTSNLKKDLTDLSAVLANIHDSFDLKHRNNPRKPSNRLSADRLKKWLVEKANNFHFKTEAKSQMADIVFIAEGSTHDVLLRKAHDLSAVFPGLNIQVITGNDYMRDSESYFSGSGKDFSMGKNTLVFCASQSGMTFSNVESVRDAEYRRRKGQLMDVFIMTGEWFSVMGDSLGQEFFPDSEFSGRLFSNMSGRRYSEAATMATATDFFFSELFLDIFSDISDLQPFNMKLSKEGVAQLKKQIIPLINTAIPELTGVDANKNLVPSDVHRRLLERGWYLSDSVSEQLFMISMLRIYTFVSVTLHLPIFRLMTMILVGAVLLTTGLPSWSSLFDGTLMAFLGLAGGVLFHFANILDALFYSHQDILFTYLIRLLQGRPIRARIGPRFLAIGGPHSRLLREYFRASVLEAPGVLQFAGVDGADLDGDFMHRFKDSNRGALVFFHIDDSESPEPSHQSDATSARMTFNQTNGVQNWGVGPEIIINSIAPQKESQYVVPSVAVDNSEGQPVGGYSKNDSVFNDLHSRWFNELKLLVSGQVVAAEMSDNLSKARMRFYVRRSDSPLQIFLENMARPVSAAYSAIALRANAIMMKRFFRSGQESRIFEPGKGQSGLTVFTTQIMPPHPLDKQAAERDISAIADHLRNFGLNESMPWVPESGPIAVAMARLYDPILAVHKNTGGNERAVATNAAPATALGSGYPQRKSNTRRYSWGIFGGNGSTLYSGWMIGFILGAVALFDQLHISHPSAVLTTATILFGGVWFLMRRQTGPPPSLRLAFETLERRDFLNALPLTEAPKTGPPEPAWVEVAHNNLLNIIQINAQEKVLVDSDSSQINQIRLDYVLNERPVVNVLDHFGFDVSGKAESFLLTQKVDGRTKQIPGEFSEFDPQGRPLIGKAFDADSGQTFEFSFEHNSFISDSIIGFVSDATITDSAGHSIVLVIDPSQIEYSDGALSIEIVPTPLSRMPPLPKVREVRPVVDLDSSPSNSPPPPQIPLFGSRNSEEEMDEETGLPPEAALAIAPNYEILDRLPPDREPADVKADAAAPEVENERTATIISAKAEAQAPNLPRQNVEGLIASGDRFRGGDGGSAINQNLTPISDESWVPFDPRAALLLGAGIVSMAASSTASRFSLARLTDWLARPKVALSRDHKTLTLKFSRRSKIEVWFPSGATEREVHFRSVNGNGPFRLIGGAMEVHLNRATGELRFQSPQENGPVFLVPNPNGGVDRHTSLVLPLNEKYQLPASLPTDTADWSAARKILRVLFISIAFLCLGAALTLWVGPSLARLDAESLLHWTAKKMAWAQQHKIELTNWTGLIGSTLLIFWIFRDKSPLSTHESWRKNLKTWFYRGLFLATLIGINLLPIQWWVPAYLTAAGFGLFYGSVAFAYFIFVPFAWALRLISLLFRWHPAFSAKASLYKDLKAVLGMSLVIGLAAVGWRSRERLLPEKPEARLERMMKDFSHTPWPKTVSKSGTPFNQNTSLNQDEVPVKNFKTQFSRDFAVNPVRFQSGPTSSLVVLRAQKQGVREVHPNASFSKMEWVDPLNEIPLMGQEPMLRLIRPVLEKKASDLSKEINYRKQVLEHFDEAGLFDGNFIKAATKLTSWAEIISLELEHFQLAQEVDVYGHVLTPFKEGETGRAIASQRMLGTMSSSPMNTPQDKLSEIDSPSDIRGENGQELFQSDRRLTLQVVLSMRDWIMFDTHRIKASLTMRDGHTHQASVKACDFEHRLDDTTLLTLALYSDKNIFGPDRLPLSVHIEMPMRTVPVHAEDPRAEDPRLESSWPASWITMGKRTSSPVQTTGIASRVDFYVDECDWVSAAQVVAGANKRDQARRIALLKETRKFADAGTKFLTRLEKLRKQKNVVYDPPEVKKFMAVFRQINELLSEQGFVEYQSPHEGLIVGTFNSQGQAIGDGPVAQILGPEIFAVDLIEAHVPVQINDICKVRSVTGEETLGVVFDVKPALGVGSGRQNQSQMKGVLIKIPGKRVWWGDGQYGIQVIYRPGGFATSPRESSDVPPPLYPVRYIQPPDEETKTLLVQRLLKAAQAAHHPPVVLETPKDWPVGKVSSDDSEIVRKIILDPNSDSRRDHLRRHLEDEGVNEAEMKSLVLKGYSDTRQMTLDHLFAQRRIEDLIRFHQLLFDQDPNSDMTLLARSHILALIDLGSFNEKDKHGHPIEDPLERLSLSGSRSEERGAAGRFLTSVLCLPQAGYNPHTELTVRRILSSQFWKTYADKIQLARDLEWATETPVNQNLRAKAANLLRSWVFADIALHTLRNLGPYEEEAVHLDWWDWLDDNRWLRLQDMLASDAADREFLPHSPWTLTEQDPEIYFKGLMSNDLYELTRIEYQALLEQAKQAPLGRIRVDNYGSADAIPKADHVFDQLNLAAQETEHLPGLNSPHAIERFIHIAARAASRNQYYRFRLEQSVRLLMKMENLELRNFLLARITVETQDPGLLSFLLDKDVDDLLVQHMTQMKIYSQADPGLLMMHQQALIKLCGLMTADDSYERREDTLRTVIESLSDSELMDIVSPAETPRTTIRDVMEGAGIPEEVFVSMAQVEFSKHALLWGTPQVKKWSGLTIGSQKLTPEVSALNNIEDALSPHHFDPKDLERALRFGLQNHPSAFDKLGEAYELRKNRLKNVSSHDRVEHLDIWRLGAGLVLTVLGLLLGATLRILRSKKSEALLINEIGSSHLGWRRWLPPWLSGLILWTALFLSSEQEGFAAPVHSIQPGIAPTRDSRPLEVMPTVSLGLADLYDRIPHSEKRRDNSPDEKLPWDIKASRMIEIKIKKIRHLNRHA